MDFIFKNELMDNCWVFVKNCRWISFGKMDRRKMFKFSFKKLDEFLLKI